MPELPEVETVVRGLRPAVEGRRITRAQARRADMIRPQGFDLAGRLTGRIIAAVARRAKYILFTLDDGNRWCIHLGMTGRLTLAAPQAEHRPHTHLVLELAPREPAPRHVGSASADQLPQMVTSGRSAEADPTHPLELRLSDPRRFGHIKWLGQRDPVHPSLGPEPLDITPADFGRRLAKTRRAIKTALLDQSLLAGLGNIYADEALFAARIHPRRPARRLSSDQVRRLCRAIKSILRRAISHRGSTFRDYADATGSAGTFQRLHRVYGREGQPCARCGNPIARIVLGGRSTHFCPECQRAGPLP